MTELQDSKKPSNKQKHERVSLTPCSGLKVDELVSSVSKALGEDVPVNRNILVNFIIEKHSGKLNVRELNEIRSQYFDQVKYLRTLYEKAKRLRAEGAKVDLTYLLKGRVDNDEGSTPNQREKIIKNSRKPHKIKPVGIANDVQEHSQNSFEKTLKD